uniref:UDP-glycosyltransferase 90A1-like n=1 Tax=Erigeron canadensis TaxID=72917 RepID=UPI001CB8E0DC|nr:UDP-glycosyltransferase 90A1-like [Erigeron canadensis]
MTISTPPHFVIFPFMSKGHAIPLLYLARILANRHISVTIITTPSNYTNTKTTLENDPIIIINIPFPENIPDAPPGVEVIDKLPSMSTFINFVNATEHLKPRFEEVVSSLPHATCIISDGFLFWTQESAEKLGIPRLMFYGMNIFSMTISNIKEKFKPHATVSSDDELFSIPGFPRIKLTANDFERLWSDLDPKDPMLDLLVKTEKAMVRSNGMVVNSFYELESEFNDYWNRNFEPKAWLVGPFCVAKPQAPKRVKRPTWIEWLDKKLLENEPVIYVSFGSQAEVSQDQVLEVAQGLEKSNISFMWALKQKQLELITGEFEERVKGRGKVVTTWVDQMEILKHEGVCGFLSHCGWNSMLESMCAGVAVLAMPLIAEQHLNARMVVEEIGMGLRLWPRDRKARGIVEAKEVAKMVVELMKGEGGTRVRKRVNEVKEAAYGAMKEGGSSSKALDSLIKHVCEGVRLAV